MSAGPPPPSREKPSNARLVVPHHVTSWFSSQALAEAQRSPQRPSVTQAGLQFNSFRDTVISPRAGNVLDVVAPVPPQRQDLKLLIPLVSRMEARTSVNTIEIESWLPKPARSTSLAPAPPVRPKVAQPSDRPPRPFVTIPSSHLVVRSSPLPLPPDPRIGRAISPSPRRHPYAKPYSSYQSPSSFTNHPSPALATPPEERSSKPTPAKLRRKVKAPSSPLHAKFVTARSHTMSISSARLVQSPLNSPSASPAGFEGPKHPFEGLRRPSALASEIHPPPSFLQRHGPSDSTTSLSSAVSSNGSRSIARKATKILGLPPPPDSPYGDKFYAAPPRPGFISHAARSSMGSMVSATMPSPSTASQLNSALYTPIQDEYLLREGASPGLTAKGLFVDGGGGQPVPTKAQKILGLLAPKASKILGVEEESSSSGHGSSYKHESVSSSDSSWAAVHDVDDHTIEIDKLPLEPPRLPDLRPTSGGFDSLLQSLAKPYTPPNPPALNLRPGLRHQKQNVLAPSARESHFLPGSPLFARKNSKALRLKAPSNQNARHQTAQYTILSASLSPHPPKTLPHKHSLKSLRSAASTQTHVLNVSPIPPDLREAVLTANGVFKTLEEIENDAWSDDGQGVATTDESAAVRVGEMMLSSPVTTEESAEVVQAAVGRLSRAVSLASISEIMSRASSQPVPALPSRQQPSAYTVPRCKRSDTIASAGTHSSIASNHTCSQPTVLLRTSSNSKPQRLLNRAPLPVDLVFSSSSPCFHLSARKYDTLVDFLSSSPSTTFTSVPARQGRLIYVTLTEESDEYGLEVGGDDTFTLSFSIHPRRLHRAPSSAGDHTGLGVGAILGDRAALQVARVVMRSGEKVEDLLQRLRGSQVGELSEGP